MWARPLTGLLACGLALGGVTAPSASAATPAPVAVRMATSTTPGAVFGWGFNVGGETNIAADAQSGVTGISAGTGHGLALKNGRVISWGGLLTGDVPSEAQSGVSAIAAGNEASLAIKDGKVIAWGTSLGGVTSVPADAKSGVTAVSSGLNFAAAIKDGKVITWGNEAPAVPTSAQSGVNAVAATWKHVLALKAGRVLAWGFNDKGQSTVPLAAQSGVSAIAAGATHSLALKDGRVLAWGSNEFGQTTVPTEAQSGVTAIAAGFAISYALKDDKVIVWGQRPSGTLPVPPQIQSGVLAISASADTLLVIRTVPVGAVTAWGSNGGGQSTVPVAAQTGVNAVAAGGAHSLALKAGRVIAWGSNVRGESTVPTDAQTGVAAISAGGAFSLALKGGSVLCWGGGLSGECSVPFGLSDVSAISAGSSHSLAIRNGEVIAWGSNDSGQTDVPAEAKSGVTAVAAGGGYSLALKSGKVIAWGANPFGQTALPAEVQSGVVAIAAGVRQAYALKNGRVIGWGLADEGQLNIPVAAQSGVTATSTYGGFGLALKAGGVLAWGINNAGQTTVPAEAQSGVVAIAAGSEHSLAITTKSALTGVVRDAATSKAVSGATIALIDASGRAATRYATSNASGQYSFALEASAGSYQVVYQPRPQDPYRPESSGTISTAGGQTITYDFSLLPGVALTGKVTNLAGKGIAGAIVQVHAMPTAAWPDRPTLLTEVPTATDGSYAFRNVSPRPVQVFVMGNPAATVKYTPEWYWDTSDRAQAQTIDLTQRTSFTMGTTTLEAVPGTAGTLKGRITGGGVGLGSVEVRLTTEDGGSILKKVTTNGSGDYTITGVAAGNYGLDLVPAASSPFLPSYGDLVRIVAGSTTTLNDTLERGGGARGTVKDDQGNPIAGVSIEARISLYPLMITVTKAVSDATGAYTFAALPTDREVTFYYTATDLPTYYTPQWYAGSSTSTNASYITPVVGQTVTLQDIAMTAGTSASGTIRGQVVNEGFYGVENATVTAYNGGGVALASGTTDEDGVYEISGLPPGPVYLQAIDDAKAVPGFISEWYLDSSSLTTATPFFVLGDQVSTPSDIVTQEGVAFRGRMGDYDTEDPVDGVVHVIDSAGVSRTVSVVNGEYAMSGVPPGAYTVYGSPNGGYLPMWWDYAATQDQARKVQAESGEFYNADFWVTKTPYEPNFISLIKGSAVKRQVTVTWEATIGAGTYQLQRAKGTSWVAVATTTALTRTDTVPLTTSWTSPICYRLRVVSPAGSAGPWGRDCTD